MGDINFLQKAIVLVSQAADKDEEKQWAEALHLYSSGLQHFSLALKYEKNEKTKELVKNKMEEYLKRAEHLKKIVAEESKKTVPIADAKGKRTGEPSEGEESKRFKEMFEGSVLHEKPNVKWDDIAGLFGAKEALKEAAIMPIKFPHIFDEDVCRPWRGILLYGPPGTGKSYLAKAVATEAKSTFFSVSTHNLISKWQGETEKLVRALFESAREKRPSIIFIDEIDSIGGARSDGDNESSRRMKAQILCEMEGVGNDNDGILVLAATNTPWTLDSALRRRFEKRIYIPLPDHNARMTLLQNGLKKRRHSLTLADFRELASNTAMYSGADIITLIRESVMRQIRAVQSATHFKVISGPSPKNPNEIADDLLEACSPGDEGAIEMAWMEMDGSKLAFPTVSIKEFRASLRQTRPSVCQRDIEQHIQFTEEFGQEG
eukprot:TRINITY_DN6585_c0_g1_i1.p1 TRINITY_DN6585_c0_g1~~TRINITY_DN6585_c0_g1_i1.p1  ORF type:complete len:461 (-),score=159.11 TRINITY_DN6585_c0_g1_i1:63-1361(-)